MTYDFQKMLDFSIGQRSETDAATIKSLLHGCQTVVKNTVEGNDKGVDYIATLRRGTQVLIDAKTRQKGCSRFWHSGPELAIEIYSVIPGGKFNTPPDRARAGWTLDESKLTGMILYTFDPSDSMLAYLLPFQSLRMAAVNNYKAWMGFCKVDTQTSGSWQSQAVFVPACFVIDAIKETFIGDLAS
jgi:hypothetical protein